IVWVEADGDRVLTRSGAALRVARHLGGGWRLLSGALRLVPRALRDAAYDAVARRRCDITTAVRRRTAPPAAPGA
ncbi:MAG TPA: DCC1-like thiol-disulfide oxidoreductase family protein, partial [Gemmatimonadaceae bacterium]|nr:DCC1-like thiol-disulfide oxidoreductase family protein [Gemmatimonadaceae bacterium]